MPRAMQRVSIMAVIAISGAVVGGAALAEQKGTAEQREACTPDAFRLCITSMPDEAAVEQCLRRAGPKLSPACYAVVNPAPPPETQANKRLPASAGQAYARQPDPAPRGDRLVRPAPVPQVVVPSGDDDD